MKGEMTFDEWFDIFVAECSKLGYKGSIDRGSAFTDYDDEQSPEFAASEFVKQMQH